MQLIKYGTYGFLSLIMAHQLAMTPVARGADADRAALNAKKEARSMKSKVKKAAGRNLIGQRSQLHKKENSKIG